MLHPFKGHKTFHLFYSELWCSKLRSIPHDVGACKVAKEASDGFSGWLL